MNFKTIFVENDINKPQADMFLMSNCFHFIISNSSFAWWAAWLSRMAHNKTVIMPNTWYTGKLRQEGEMTMKALCPDEWITIGV
jgi:hypothetical protein